MSRTPRTSSTGTSRSRTPGTSSTGTSRSRTPVTSSTGTSRSRTPVTSSTGTSRRRTPVTSSTGTSRSSDWEAWNADLRWCYHRHHLYAHTLTGIWVQLLEGVAATGGTLAGAPEHRARARIEHLSHSAKGWRVAGTRALTLDVVEGQGERTRLLDTSAHGLTAAACVAEGLARGTSNNSWTLALTGSSVEILTRIARDLVGALTAAGLSVQHLVARTRNVAGRVIGRGQGLGRDWLMRPANVHI